MNEKDAIVSKAIECEKCLRLADFAETAPEYGDSGARIGEGMRRMAAMYSNEAFDWAKPRTTTA